ncbi:MAG: HEAT repeat domain-containing protein, partial [Verrucomicrobiae bacterium]|nr:HEAT repeat domain-containing protein [Verrucomicrobiae bacterium]
VIVIVALVGCGKQDSPPAPSPAAPTPATPQPRAAPPPLPMDELVTVTSPDPNHDHKPAADSANEILRRYQSHWNDPDERGRLIDSVALQAMETGDKKQAIQLFTEMLRVETAPELKMTLLDELGSTEHPAALAPILARLSPNEPEEVREAALTAAETLVSMLGFEKNTDAFEPVVALLDPRYPTSLRELAISTLEDLEDKRAIPHLQRLLSDPDEVVRTAAREAIDWLQHEE